MVLVDDHQRHEALAGIRHRDLYRPGIEIEYGLRINRVAVRPHDRAFDGQLAVVKEFPQRAALRCSSEIHVRLGAVEIIGRDWNGVLRLRNGWHREHESAQRDLEFHSLPPSLNRSLPSVIMRSEARVGRLDPSPTGKRRVNYRNIVRVGAPCVSCIVLSDVSLIPVWRVKTNFWRHTTGHAPEASRTYAVTDDKPRRRGAGEAPSKTGSFLMIDVDSPPLAPMCTACGAELMFDSERSSLLRGSDLHGRIRHGYSPSTLR